MIDATLAPSRGMTASPFANWWRTRCLPYQAKESSAEANAAVRAFRRLSALALTLAAAPNAAAAPPFWAASTASSAAATASASFARAAEIKARARSRASSVFALSASLMAALASATADSASEWAAFALSNSVGSALPEPPLPPLPPKSASVTSAPGVVPGALSPEHEPSSNAMPQARPAKSFKFTVVSPTFRLRLIQIPAYEPFD